MSTKLHSTEPVVDKDFLNHHKRLPEKSAATIRFFDRGDYFSLHGSDAVFAAKDFFKTNNALKTWKSGSMELETCYVKSNNFETLLKDLLLVKQYRVEIWKKNSKTYEWTLHNHGSPGNLGQFEDILYSSDDNQSTDPVSDPGLISIQIIYEDNINKLIVGYIDKTSRVFLVTTISFKDSLTDLESLLIHLGPKECLIPSSGGNRDYYNKLVKTLEKNDILVTERKKGDFAFDLACSDLNKLIKMTGEQNVSNLNELAEKDLIGSLNAIIKYLSLLDDSSNEQVFKLKSYNLNNYLKLDSGAFNSLNLLPNKTSSNNKNHSLYGVLNKCVTNQGQRLLTQWIKQPLIDIHKIEERQNIVEILLKDTELRMNLVDNYLKRFPDFQKIEWRFIKGKATLQDCYKMYMAIETLPHMFESMIKTEGPNAHLINEMFTNPLNSLMSDFSNFQDMIETTIDLKQVQNHLFIIKSSYDPDLQELKDRLDDIEDKLDRLSDKTAKELDLPSKTVKLESNPVNGYYFRISRKDDASLKRIKDAKVIATNKDGIKFQTDKLEAVNDEWIGLKESYEEAQKTVVDQILQISTGYLDPLQVLNNLVAELDIYVSFAQVALSSQNEYVRPKLHALGSGILNLKESRHPCLELQDGLSFIPNDADFKKDEKMFCIITGPNMGGKSTYIRQLGVIALMAQIGSFVPCQSAEIGIFDCILARIGANDCQNKGVSTFMAEMLETSFILKTATKNSLVIIDELGRGTSTYDGFGLAWAISDFLVKEVQCFTLFATHFHELTALSEEVKTVFNCHVTALTNENSLILLYKIKPGVCDQSFGIHVAHLANFPKHVIEYAKDKARYLEDYCPMDEEQVENSADNNKKYVYKQETGALIDDCFSKLKEIDMSSLSDEDFLKKVTETVQQQAGLTENPYFKMLVNKI